MHFFDAAAKLAGVRAVRITSGGAPAGPLCHYRFGIMDFTYSDKTKALIDRVQDFMDRHIYPNEAAFYAQHDALPDRWDVPPVLEELKTKAKEADLWNLFLPESKRGAGLTNLEYAPLCEIKASGADGPSG